MDTAAQFDKVDILFAGAEGGEARRRTDAALALLDAGHTRSEIIEQTGVVTGAAGIELAVERGEVFVVMGLSGSGKSTILRALNGLNRVSRGRVLVRHKDDLVDLTAPEPRILRAVRNQAMSMVFQHFALLPWRSVRRNVELGLELRGMKPEAMRAVVDEWLDVVGLLPWADKYADELSGGMQQRVGLARALVTDPGILLMDEPFSALDPLIRNKLQDELLSLQNRLHKTIIFVTHDLDEALKIGNRIAIMKDGRVVQIGNPEDIVLRPADDYVADFVKHMNPLTALRAVSLMTPVGALPMHDGRHEFHDSETYVLALHADGRLDRLACASDGAGGTAELLAEAAPMTASPRATLKDVLELRQQTRRPVLICEDGKVLGLCGVNEILDALTNAGRAAIAETA